jgi:hypothetical protein
MLFAFVFVCRYASLVATLAVSGLFALFVTLPSQRQALLIPVSWRVFDAFGFACQPQA